MGRQWRSVLMLTALAVVAGCSEQTGQSRDYRPTQASEIDATKVGQWVELTGYIVNVQPGDRVHQYELLDSSEKSITVRTHADYPSQAELAAPMVVQGEVRVDQATSQAYVYEHQRFIAGGRPDWWLYVLIGAGALLIILAIVLAVLLGTKKEPAGQPAVIPGGARLGDTMEVPSTSGARAATEEFAPPGEPLTAEFLGASLNVIEGPDAGKAGFPLLKRTTTIGRNADRDIRLTDPTVSREHARIIAKDDGTLLLLNESTKGTMVNEQLVDSHALRNGDQIRLGGTVLEMRLAGKPASVAAVAGAETAEFVGAGAAVAPRPPAPGGTQEFLGAQLRVTSGPHEGKVFVLSKAVTSIGRDEVNDWALGEDDMTVSGSHCEVHHKSGAFTLVAKPDSQKGHKPVLVNGDEVVTRELQGGDEIQLGGTKIVFEKV